MPDFDVSHILRDWPFDPDHTVRIIVTGDGRSVVQVRLPLGLEQYELDGRPDGTRPRGAESVVAYVENRLRHHIITNGSELGFEIGSNLAQELQAEGVLYYYRYLLLFQINDHGRVVRDTAHNLHLCDLLERYCTDEAQRDAVLQYRPYIIRINAAARAILASKGEIDQSPEAIVEEAIELIQALPEIDQPTFQFERARSAGFLRALVRTLQNTGSRERFHETGVHDAARPSLHRTHPEPRRAALLTKLERELRRAVEAENYEQAAQLRDKIRSLSTD